MVTGSGKKGYCVPAPVYCPRLIRTPLQPRTKRAGFPKPGSTASLNLLCGDMSVSESGSGGLGDSGLLDHRSSTSALLFLLGGLALPQLRDAGGSVFRACSHVGVDLLNVTMEDQIAVLVEF